MYAGTGYYRLEREQLERYREAVDEELAEAVAGAERAGLEIRGEQLKTAPRGYPRDHPQIDLLRRKQLIIGAALPAGRGISGERALAHARTCGMRPSRSWPGSTPASGASGQRR